MTLATRSQPDAGRRFEASDARADERRRVVLVARESIVIARSVGGVFMRIALKPRAYRGVLLSLTGLDGVGFRYEIRLSHRDPDFGVLLAELRDQNEAEAAWRDWARYLGLPELVERVEGVVEDAQSKLGAVVVGRPGLRRRGRALGSRRARFLTRRKMGRPELCVCVAAEPHELFRGSLP
jgi:Family of unknown function (DUF6101)